MNYLVHLLWQISWQVALVATAAWVVSRLTGKAPAAWRHALWLIVLVKFFVPPFVHLPSELAFWHEVKPVQVASPVGDFLTPDNAKPIAGIISPQPEVVHTAVAHIPIPSLTDILVLAWLACMCVMVVVLLVRYVRQAKLLRNSTPAEGELAELLASATERMKVRRLPRIMLSDKVSTPVLVGLFRPVILLPPGISDSCSPAEMSAMFMHELAHIKRWDMAGVWLHQLAKALFFFHPAVWLAGLELRKERELACDELVLDTSIVTRQEYAAGYISALKLANGVAGHATALGMAEPFNIEKRRLKMILRNAIPKMSARWAGMLLLIAIVGLPTFAGVAISTGKVPTIDDIRAAWDRQNTGTIAVRYVTDLSRLHGDSKPAASGGGKFLTVADPAKNTLRDYTTTYIRTPEMLYEKSWIGIEKSVERLGVTRLGEGRQVEVYGSNKSRIVQPGAEMERSWLMGGMETILYRNYRRDDDPNTQFLYGWLKYAKVAERTEKIDGHECWKLDITDVGKGGVVEHYQVWVDPTIGYCPRRTVTEGTACGSERGKMGPFKIVDDFTDYREISNGIWFPGKHVMVKNMKAASMVNGTTVDTLKEVYKNRPCSKNDLTIKFEPGVMVYRATSKDERGYYIREECTVAADGTLIPHD